MKTSVISLPNGELAESAKAVWFVADVRNQGKFQI